MEIFKSHPTQQTPGFSKSKYQNQLNKRDYIVNAIREKASGLWPSILESLGIPPVYLKNKHGPCPICRQGKDRFRFDDKDRGLYFCNQCSAGDGFKLLQLYHGWSFPYVLNCVAKVLGHQSVCGIKHTQGRHINRMTQPVTISNDDVLKRKKRLNTAWLGAKPITQNDPVDCYLKARGIFLTNFPSVLRFHPTLPYYDDEKTLVGHFPAMLGLVQDRNQYVSIHRTYLGNGCKADLPKPKKLMTSIHPGASLGSAIKLFQPVSGKLALAEGIETALAFHVATQMPVWSTISAIGMEKIKLPPAITDITIAVDNDESGCGQKAAFILSQRLLAEGRAVRRVMPPKVGYDFADMLVEACQ